MSSFSLDVAEFVKKAKGKVDQVVYKVVLDIGTRIVERSPVGNPELWAINRGKTKVQAPKGYVGGRFRANWQYGNYSGAGIPLSDLPDIDPTGQASINRILQGLPLRAGGILHVIVNNLPYSVPLEEGWSTQAPAGMVGLTIVEFKGLVDAAARAVRE